MSFSSDILPLKHKEGIKIIMFRQKKKERRMYFGKKGVHSYRKLTMTDQSAHVDNGQERVEQGSQV
jgi:hypothetical protein